MKKILVILLSVLCAVSVFGTDLTPDFSDGNPLTAAELNNWKDERSGHLLPISATSNNYVDGVNDLGSSSYRWRNVNAAGSLRVSGMPGFSAYASSNALTAINSSSASTTLNFDVLEFNTGDLFSTSTYEATVVESGYYAITLIMIMDEAQGGTGHYLTAKIFKNYTEIRSVGTWMLGTVKDEKPICFSDVMYLSTNDIISFKAQSDGAPDATSLLTGVKGTRASMVKLY